MCWYFYIWYLYFDISIKTSNVTSCDTQIFEDCFRVYRKGPFPIHYCITHHPWAILVFFFFFSVVFLGGSSETLNSPCGLWVKENLEAPSQLWEEPCRYEDPKCRSPHGWHQGFPLPHCQVTHSYEYLNIHIQMWSYSLVWSRLYLKTPHFLGSMKN